MRVKCLTQEHNTMQPRSQGFSFLREAVGKSPGNEVDNNDPGQ